LTLSPEMTEFCDAWILKAELHNGTALHDYYNRAFTLFTTYNRLYAEATFTLARERKIRLRQEGHCFDQSRTFSTKADIALLTEGAFFCDCTL